MRKGARTGESLKPDEVIGGPEERPGPTSPDLKRIRAMFDAMVPRLECLICALGRRK